MVKLATVTHNSVHLAKLLVKSTKISYIVWFTNLDTSKRHEELILYRKFDPEIYPTFDHYNAININLLADIPVDYAGAMGVPISFIDKYNPNQFEILSADELIKSEVTNQKGHGLIKDKEAAICGKPTYVRVVIRHKKRGGTDED